MLKFVFQCMVIVQISYACDPNGANRICETEYNTYLCDYDYGDCCKKSCYSDVGNTGDAQAIVEGDCDVGNVRGCTGQCHYGYYPDCIDPDYNPWWNESVYETVMEKYGNTGGAHKKTTSDVICMSIWPEDDFQYQPALGSWQLNDDDSLHEKMSDLYTYYEYYCERNLTDSEQSACNEKEYISPDGRHYLTYCCVMDLWIIIPAEWFKMSHADFIASEVVNIYGAVGVKRYWDDNFFGFYYAVSKKGDFNAIEKWYRNRDGDGEYWNYVQEDSIDIRVFEGDCSTAGWIINCVLLVIFIIICVYSCYKIGIKNVSEILDAFEKQVARIEFIIIGVCFGDSFISSLFISISIPGLHEISIGVILLMFGVVNFICFALRMYITKAHILESESIGSLSDFSFDFGLGFIFLIVSITIEASDFFGFFVLLFTYCGVIEEFAQLFRKIKNESIQKYCVPPIDRYLEYSGRVLATANMAVLLLFCAMLLVDPSNARPKKNRGWLWSIMIWSLIVLFAAVYSWYAYVGCCGKCGGHKEFDKTTDLTTDLTTSKDKEDKKESELIHVEILHRHGDRIPIYFLQKESIEAQIWIPMIPKQYKWVEYDTSEHQVKYLVDETELFSWEFINKSMLKYTQIVSTESESESKEDIDIYTSNKSNKVPWSGLLTKTGVTQLKETGEYLRDRYINELGFLPHDIGAFKDNVYYQSTDDTRNIYSAESLLSTLYPDISSSQQRINLYIDRKHDNMFAPYDTKNRAHWKALLDKNEEFATNNLLNPELQKVTDEVLAKFDKKLGGDTGEIFLVQDSYTCITDHANDDNAVIVEERENNVIDIALAQELKKLVFKQCLYGLANDVRKDKESLRCATGALLHKIYNNLKDSAADENSPKCRIYSCHDETLIPLLCALNKNIENIMDLSDSYSWPPYGSTLCFEVWRKNASDGDKARYVVKVRYDKKESTINGESEMTLDELYSFWKDIMDKGDESDDGRVETVIDVKDTADN